MYVLDTNVVSELRRSQPHKGVLWWIEDIPADRLFLSVVTIGEIQAGIEVMREQDPPKAEELGGWLDQVETSYGILPMDADTFRIWARFMHRKSDALSIDAMIAATAARHGLAVATRNEKDFRRFAVEIVKPFTGMRHR